ncbi:hypothetical protein ILUMI_12910, partial [Ignelater luminosus]
NQTINMKIALLNLTKNSKMKQIAIVHLKKETAKTSLTVRVLVMGKLVKTKKVLLGIPARQ